MWRARAVGTAGAVTILALTGCGSERRATPTTAACAPLPGAATSPRTGGQAAELAYLTSVKLGGDGCVDRITFAFTTDRLGVAPGFRADYEPRRQAGTEDGSGRRIPIAGRAFLVVRLQPTATAKIAGEQLRFTYKGPRRVEGTKTGHVQEAVKTGDFEAAVTWAIGLDERRPFTVVASPGLLVLTIG